MTDISIADPGQKSEAILRFLPQVFTLYTEDFVMVLDPD